MNDEGGRGSKGSRSFWVQDLVVDLDAVSLPEMGNERAPMRTRRGLWNAKDVKRSIR